VNDALAFIPAFTAVVLLFYLMVAKAIAITLA